MDFSKAGKSEIILNCKFFPSEIMIEILSRVPVKSLGRCSCVSKSWKSLITSQMFIQTHTKNYRNLAESTYILLMPSHIKIFEKYTYSLFSDKTFLKIGTFVLPMLYARLELLFIGNSCNGIICCTDRKTFYGRQVFLYNPSLRKIRIIAYDCFADSMYERRVVYTKLGFGISQRNNNELKVVRIHYIKDSNSKMLGDIPPLVEVYSLKAGSWRIIIADIKCIVHQRSVSCNGAVYWLARKTDRWGVDTILSFDVTNEIFREIALPAESNSFIDGTILVFKGLLAFCKDAFNNRDDGVKCYELWVMMEHNVTNSWKKLSTIVTNQPVSKLIGFTKGGELIMELERGTLACWDPLNNQFDILKIDGFMNHVDASFDESLVLYGEESTTSADATLMLPLTRSSIQDLPLNIGTCKILVHGDDVKVRVGGDVNMVDYGINELKNLCRIQPALVAVMAKPQNTPPALQLSVQNYCLIVLQNQLDGIPQSVKDFLADPSICIVTVGIGRLDISPFNIEETNSIPFVELVHRALKRKNYHRVFPLKVLAAKVGVTLDEFDAGYGSALDWNAAEIDLQLAVHHVYASYKIGRKLLSLLNVSF